MRQLVVSNRFKKQLKNFLIKHPELRGVFKEKLDILQKNPLDKRLKTHKLTGKLKKCHAISITHEYRLILYFENQNIYLLAVGSHDEVY
ncbi:MAG: type II toxin-antitoxin system mRNA interferase toxin, RelE/StbE family [bacterium]|nr:type II toxin-antitoxin system mRNA interferase toxin, RelE/StbE family [bacterium]